MKKITTILLYFLNCVCLEANAQLMDTTRIQYQVSVSGNISKGNIEKIILNNEASLGYVGNKVGFSTVNTFFYFENNAKKLDADLMSRNLFYFKPKSRFYPFAMWWYEENFRRKITSRTQTGIGVSYRLIEKLKHKIKLSTMFTHEELNFIGANFTDNNNPAKSNVSSQRFTLRVIGTHKFENKMRLSYEIWQQNEFSEDLKPRLYGELKIDFPIVEHLKFRLSTLYGYEKVVYENIKNTDFNIIFGLNYDFR